jgi:hypothetical protein
MDGQPPMSGSGSKADIWLRLADALPPKADIDGRSPDVRFVPKADIDRLFDGRKFPTGIYTHA